MKKIFTLLLANLLLVAGSNLKADDAYTVGIVPQYEASKIHKIWRPILDYLEQETSEKFELRGSYSIPAFEKQFSAGAFDFAYMNPYHLVIANEKAGYIPLFRDNGRKLFGVLVTRKDSGIESPADLQDKFVAFPAPNALGASLQIRQELKEVFKIDIKPMYVKTHDSVYLNVLMQRATAGGGVQKTLSQQKQDYQDALKIIHTTTPINPHPFAALPRIPEELRTKITNAIIALGNTEEGKVLLSKVPYKQVGPAAMDDYKPLLEMGLQKYYVSE